MPVADDDAVRSALDDALLAYLRAYEDYTTLHVEMEAQLKNGFFNMSRARKDLGNRSTMLGQELFPKEIEPLIVLAKEPAEVEGDPPSLRYEFCEEGAAVTGREDRVDPDDPDEPSEDDQDEGSVMEALARMGVRPEMLREIAAAVRNDGSEVGLAVGDTLVIEDPSSGVAKVQRSAPVSLAASNLSDLKRAQFQAELDSDEAYTASRPLQLKPNAKRDPLRWFTVMPPPSLRQGQQCFRRAAETTAALANAQAQMHATREHFEALQAQLIESWPLVE
jgi:hypothetical protein